MCSLTAGPAHAGHPRGRRHLLRAPPPALCRRFELHRSVGLYRRYARQLKPACAPSLLMKLLNARSNHVNARRYHWHRCCRHCRRVFQAFAATLALLHFSHASRAGSKTWLYFEREPLAWCKACRCALYDHPVQMCRGSPVCAAAFPSNGRLPHRLSASVRTPGAERRAYPCHRLSRRIAATCAQERVLNSEHVQHSMTLNSFTRF